MDYFLLSAKIENAGEFFTALDSSGVAIPSRGDDGLSGVSHVYFRVTKRAKINDLAPSIGNELILSKAASGCLRTRSRFCASMRSVPATFYRTQINHIVSTEYFFWWSLKQHSVLDLQASRVRYYKHYILTVDKWVLRRELIPDCDIFLGPTNKWLVTSSFRNVCFESKLTGFHFVPLEIR